jgi:hypothetical protein
MPHMDALSSYVGVSAVQSSQEDMHRLTESCLWLKKDLVIGMCCISANHTALRITIKPWFAQKQDNVSKCSNMSTLMGVKMI